MYEKVVIRLIEKNENKWISHLRAVRTAIKEIRRLTSPWQLVRTAGEKVQGTLIFLPEADKTTWASVKLSAQATGATWLWTSLRSNRLETIVEGRTSVRTQISATVRACWAPTQITERSILTSRRWIKINSNSRIKTSNSRPSTSKSSNSSRSPSCSIRSAAFDTTSAIVKRSFIRSRITRGRTVTLLTTPAF